MAPGEDVQVHSPQHVDLHDDHLAAFDGGLDDGIPLMTVEMFPRPTSGIQSVLDVVNRRKYVLQQRTGRL